MLNNLPKTHAKSGKRVGRGPASGRGKTSRRGMNGQKSRAGKKTYRGFEGGQTRLAKRIPKLGGFKNPNRVSYQVVNIGQLENLPVDKPIDKTILAQAGLIAKATEPVKLLADGEIKHAVTIEVDKASQAATAKIAAAGGEVVLS